MKTIQIGIIGAGRIGRVHARSITNHIPNAEVAAISDIQLAAAQAAAAEYNIPKVTMDYHEILADPAVDAVMVCSSTDTHAEISMQAARAGKHVFCEKPVDTDLAKILATKNVIAETGVKMQVGFNRRFDHNFRRIHEIVQHGDLGKVEIVKITSRDPAPPSAAYVKVSGGLFLDMAIHDFDMARFQAGSEVTEVYATGAVLVDPAIGAAGDIDTAVITLQFANGALGVIDNSRRASYGYDQRVEVFGEKGAAAAENDTPTTVRVMTEKSVATDTPLYFFLERYMQSFADEVQAFIDAIENNTPTAVTIDDGLAPVVIAKAAQLSLKEHRPVTITEILKGANL